MLQRQSTPPPTPRRVKNFFESFESFLLFYLKTILRIKFDYLIIKKHTFIKKNKTPQKQRAVLYEYKTARLLKVIRLKKHPYCTGQGQSCCAGFFFGATDFFFADVFFATVFFLADTDDLRPLFASVIPNFK